MRFSSGVRRAGVLVAGGWLFLAGARTSPAAPPARPAADTLTTPSGSVLSVWEVRTRQRLDAGDEGSWSIAFSVADASGVRSGVVAGTEDAAPDRSPRLGLDARTGTPIVVWSRFDGVYQKIAYARLQGASWTDLHYLSFGRGDDVEPRIGTGRSGSYVFWASDAGYMYSPIELGGGRLIGVPHLLRLPGAATMVSPKDGVTGSDDRRERQATGDGDASRLRDPGSFLYDGQDGPVGCKGAGCKAGHATRWGVGSRGDCRRMVVAVTNDDGSRVLLFRFTNGGTGMMKSVDLPDNAPLRFVDDAAAAALDAVCN